MSLTVRIEPTLDREKHAQAMVKKVLKQTMSDLPLIPTVGAVQHRNCCHCSRLMWIPIDSYVYTCRTCRDKGLDDGE